LISYIALLIIAAIVFYIVRFLWKLLWHLLKVAGWITSDISSFFSWILIEKLMPESNEQLRESEGAEEDDAGFIPRRQLNEDYYERTIPDSGRDIYAPPRRIVSDALETADESETFVPRRSRQDPGADARYTRQDRESEGPEAFVPRRSRQDPGADARYTRRDRESEGPEISIFELMLYDFRKLEVICVQFYKTIVGFIRRTPEAFRQPFPLRAVIWYSGFFLHALALTIFFRVPDVYGYGPVVMVVLWGSGGLLGFLTLIYFLRVLIPLDMEAVFTAAGKSRRSAMNGHEERFAPFAAIRGFFLNTPLFMVLRSVLFFFVAAILLVFLSSTSGLLIAKVFKTSGLVQWSATVVAFLFLSLCLVQIKILRKGGAGEKSGGSARRLFEARNFLYGLIVAALSALTLIKLVWLGFFILGFFYSFLYFLVFKRRGDRRFTIRRFIGSWVIFGLFSFFAVVIFYFGGAFETAAGIALVVIALISVLFIHTLWVMGRKYELKSGLKELPLGQFASWFNLFITPFFKLFLSLPFFYFVILFFSINTLGFAVGLGVAAVAMIGRRVLDGLIPDYIPSGLFAGYIFLVWISIFYVQSYNRIQPTPAACGSIESTDEIKPVWTMKQFGRQPFLYGTLPYDAIADFGQRALFVTFKNLSGHGAVVRINTDNNEMVGKLVTRDDENPEEMFYPERLCIDRGAHSLYSTTKTRKDFQILSMDYSGGGLNLAGRIKFTGRETTNCEVSARDRDLYVIFLGPPDSHIEVLDGSTGEKKGETHFGRFGYADYFSIDVARDRTVVPSLDPTNLFEIYEVRRKNERGFFSSSHRMAIDFKLPGGRNISIPIPTLGIAFDAAGNRFYLTCPFLRLVLEVDGDNFKVLRHFFAGGFPREVAVNAKQRVLLVANYSGGTVDVFDIDSLKRVERLRVGKMVRSLDVDPDTGRNLVVSACGVFELRLPSKTKKER
jgi:hypothetical protein